MQPVKEKIKGIKYSLAFEVESADVEAELEKQLLKFAETHEEKGFRKGHVPLSVIRSKYENHFLNDTLNDTINKCMNEYYKAKNINPAAMPNIKIDNFVRGEKLKFSAEFEIVPEIKPIDFSKITIEKQVAKAGDKEINDSLKNIAESRYTLSEITEDRKTKKGDTVDINFVGSIDGVEFKGGKGDNYPLELGSGTFIPGFEDQLIGHKKGDNIDVNVEFPKDYGSKELAGKKALFKVKINSLKEKNIPEINDDFAKSLNRKDLADLKTYIKELLENTYETSSKNLMKDALLDKLTDEKVDIPESLVNQEVEYMLYQFKASSAQKLDEKAENKKRDEFKKDAIQRVKLGLILADVGKRENIQVDRADINNAIMQETYKYPTQSQQIIDYYSKNKQAEDMLKAEIFENKVLDLILSKVKTKEKSVDPSALTRKVK